MRDSGCPIAGRAAFSDENFAVAFASTYHQDNSQLRCSQIIMAPLTATKANTICRN